MNITLTREKGQIHLKNINCTHNDQRDWCKDKRIKRSLWGIGARLCLVAQGKPCAYQHKYHRPGPPPAPRPSPLLLKRIKECRINTDKHCNCTVAQCCPLGKVGSAPRCSLEELEAAKWQR